MTSAERRALRTALAQEWARIAARQMKAWGMSNRQIAESDLMRRRILGRKVSPTRVAHIANQRVRSGTAWEQIAEFERKYCGPEILPHEDERARRIWKELVYPGLEAALLYAEGTSGSLREQRTIPAPKETKAVEVDVRAGLVRRLLDAEARHERPLVESLCKEARRLVTEGRADRRLQLLARQVESGKVDRRLADELMASASSLEGAAPGGGPQLRIPAGPGTRVVRIALPFGSVHRALHRLRDNLIYELFENGFLGHGEYRPHPPTVSVRGDVVRALARAFGLSTRQVVRIVQ